MGTHEKAVRDSRGQKRIEVSEVIRVIDRQTGTPLGQLVNISEDGLMILSTEPVAENCIFQLSLVFSEDSDNAAEGPISIGVESLWVNSSGDQPQHWVGFYIIDISDTDLHRIRLLSN
jgi:hypothetical protein